MKEMNLENVDLVSTSFFEDIVRKVFEIELLQPEMSSLMQKYAKPGGISFKDFLQDYQKEYTVESGPFAPKTAYGPRSMVSKGWQLKELEEKLRDKVDQKTNGDHSYRFKTTRQLFSKVTRSTLRSFLCNFLGFHVTEAEAEAFYAKYRKPSSITELDVPRLVRVLLGPSDYPDPANPNQVSHIFQSTAQRHHFTETGKLPGGEGSTEQGEDGRKVYSRNSDVEACIPASPIGERPQSSAAVHRGSYRPPSRNATLDGFGNTSTYRQSLEMTANRGSGEERLRRAMILKATIAGGFKFVLAFKTCKSFCGTAALHPELLRQLALHLYNIELSSEEVNSIFSKYDSHGNGQMNLHVFLGKFLSKGLEPSGTWFQEKPSYVVMPNRRVLTQPMMSPEVAKKMNRSLAWDVKQFEQCLREKMLLKTCTGGPFQFRDAFKLFHPARGAMDSKLTKEQFIEVLDERLDMVPEEALVDKLFKKYDRERTGKISITELVRNLIPTDWDGSNFLVERNEEEKVAYRSLMKRVFGVTGKAHCLTSFKGVQSCANGGKPSQDFGEDVSNPALALNYAPKAPQRPKSAGVYRREDSNQNTFKDRPSTPTRDKIEAQRPQSARYYSRKYNPSETQEPVRSSSSSVQGSQRSNMMSPVSTGRISVKDEAFVEKTHQRILQPQNGPETDLVNDQVRDAKIKMKAEEILRAIVTAEKKRQKLKKTSSKKVGTSQKVKVKSTAAPASKEPTGRFVGKAQFVSRYGDGGKILKQLYDQTGQPFSPVQERL